MKHNQAKQARKRIMYGDTETIRGWGTSYRMRPIMRILSAKEAHEMKMPQYTKLNNKGKK